MSNVVIEFQEDTQTAFCLYVAYHDGDFLCVQHISKGDLLEYRLSLSHVESIKAIPSLSDLLAYAKANQIQQPQAETLCLRSPEISLTSGDDAVQVGKNEGNPFPPSPETLLFGKLKGDSFSKSYPKKQDITYLQALKDIKAQIEFLNKCAFDKSILTSDEHFALLGIEEELNQLIHFDPIRPADDGLPLRYDHFNCFSLPDNLE
ncbi:hypothetical protein ACI2IV_00045 [Psychrobacter faecalis]